MKKTLLILSFLVISNLLFAQNRICIQNGGIAAFANCLDSAVAIAQSGDIIYLPSGSVALLGSLDITKKLTIIGAGYNPDSSQATGRTIINQPTQTLQLAAGSEGSLITGISFNVPLWVSASDVQIIRNQVQQLSVHNNTGSQSNVLISENVLNTVNGWGTTYSNIIFDKNILFNMTSNFLGNITFSNNIFLFGGASLNSVQNCYFKNNIIFENPPSSPGFLWNILENNLFVSDSTILGVQVGSGNIFNEPVSNIFMNYNSGTSWVPNFNFHLKPGCNGIAAGNDGTDVGVFGTTTPFKEGGIPFNPHFQSVNIPSSTGANGFLNINITVKAQGN